MWVDSDFRLSVMPPATSEFTPLEVRAEVGFAVQLHSACFLLEMNICVSSPVNSAFGSEFPAPRPSADPSSEPTGNWWFITC